MQDQSSSITKKCATCKSEKPLAEFHKNQGGRFGVNSQCKACFSAYARAYNQRQKGFYKQAPVQSPITRRTFTHGSPLIPGQTSKECGWCGGTKPLSEFKAKASSRDGLERACKECISARNRKYYQSIRASVPSELKLKNVKRKSVTIGEIRKCASCEQGKRLDGFRVDSDGIGGYDWICRKCRRAEYAALMRVVRAKLDPEAIKVCFGCGQAKPITKFAAGPNRTDGLNIRCRECAGAWKKQMPSTTSAKARARGKRWREANYGWDRSQSARCSR